MIVLNLGIVNYRFIGFKIVEIMNKFIINLVSWVFFFLVVKGIEVIIYVGKEKRVRNSFKGFFKIIKDMKIGFLVLRFFRVF